MFELFPTNIPDGEGYGIRGKFNINILNESELNEIVRNISAEYNNSEKSIREVLQNLGVRPKLLSSIDIASAIKKRIGSNAALDAGMRGQEHKDRNDRSSTIRREGSQSLPGDNGGTEIEFLKTSSGEIYGFVYQGEIYMDETKLDPQVPIHEYTHIWDEAVMQSNPRLWERGKRLLRDSNNETLRNLWNEIAESDAYGKKWQAQDKTEEEIENLIAGEVQVK